MLLESAKSAPPRFHRANASVLVVDDEEPNRVLLRDVLQAQGCQIREAKNGPQALESVIARPPDLILLDVMMPGMDGFEVCRRLKQNSLTAHIPILMITALSDRQERLMGIQAGANDFLNKPVDLQDLVLRVGNALYAKSLYDQLKTEQQKSEQLLLNILPKSIARRMKNGKTTIADTHLEATVLAADLVGFTNLMDYINPHEIVFMLNEIFSAFDLLVEKLDLEKIKTVGDGYIVAGGVNSAAANPTEAIAQLAVKMQDAVLRFNAQYNTSIRMRIGISAGPLISGVIGRTKFAYDVWGAPLNLASYLQATAPPNTIQVDQAAYERLKRAYYFSQPHTVEVENQTTVTVRRLSPYALRPQTRPQDALCQVTVQA